LHSYFFITDENQLVELRGGLRVLRLRRSEEQKQLENFNQQEKRG